MSDICLKVDNLSKRFFVIVGKRTFFQLMKALFKREALKSEFWVLHDVSFKVKRGEKLALIGKNGSGKTTLLRILTDIYDKSRGRLEINDAPRMLFNSYVGLSGDLSVIDNIYLLGAIYGMTRNFLRDRVGLILNMTELYYLRFTPLKRISAGQQQRLALSVFFQNTSDFLIFDESLRFVDEGFRHKCAAYFEGLLRSDKTILMTSHDHDFLRKYCRTAIWLDEGRIRMSGRAGDVIDAYEASFSG